MQEQEAAKPDNFQHLSTGGAGEGLSKDTLPRCVCKGTAGTEDGAHRGKSAGSTPPPGTLSIVKKFGSEIF